MLEQTQPFTADKGGAVEDLVGAIECEQVVDKPLGCIDGIDQVRLREHIARLGEEVKKVVIEVTGRAAARRSP